MAITDWPADERPRERLLAFLETEQMEMTAAPSALAFFVTFTVLLPMGR